MKTKFFFPVLCALMMCFTACGDEPNGSADPIDENGAIANGVFSIGEGKQVKFSRGNLQYKASTKTWRFAENQYDCIGVGNDKIGDDYDGWIDLFGWGTGNNPTNNSMNVKDYTTFVDWGTNKISNGGNTANMWRTLTSSEMRYLLNDRPNASELYGTSTVNGVYGVIILPDKWRHSKMKLQAGAEGWTMNKLSQEKWEQWQQHGAVFLPAASERIGYKTVDDGANNHGHYWSSTQKNEERANWLTFYQSGFWVEEQGAFLFYGRSVRLVQDVE